jgi:hypothetical protein
MARLDFYSVASAGLFVPADPPTATPDPLATVPICLWLRKAMSLA